MPCRPRTVSVLIRPLPSASRTRLLTVSKYRFVTPDSTGEMDSGDRLGLFTTRRASRIALKLTPNNHSLYFAVRTSDRTYCVNYETPVLDEIDDLFSAKGERG